MAGNDGGMTAKDRYEFFLRHRESLSQIESDQEKAFSKHTLTLAAAALGLSILFMEKVADKPAPWTLGFLVMTWSFLALCILCLLISFLTSMVAHSRQIAAWDEQFKRGDDAEAPDERNPYGSLTKVLNILSITFFVVGIVCFAVFAAGNLPWS